VVLSLVRFGTKNHCAGEGHHQFNIQSLWSVDQTGLRTVVSSESQLAGAGELEDLIIDPSPSNELLRGALIAIFRLEASLHALLTCLCGIY
jgi:hypothetical protein